MILVDACGIADTSQQDVIFVKRSRRQPQPGDTSGASPNDELSSEQPGTENGLPETEGKTVDEIAINSKCIESPDASPSCLKSVHDYLESPDEPETANGLRETEGKTLDVTVDEIAIISDCSMSPNASPSCRKRVHDDFDGEDRLSTCKITYEVFPKTSVKRECTCHLTKYLWQCDSCVVKLERPKAEVKPSVKPGCTCHLTKDLCDNCVVQLERLKPKQEDAPKLECTCNETTGLCDNCIVQLERSQPEPKPSVKPGCTCHLTKDLCDRCVVQLERLKPKQEDAPKLECTCNITTGLCDNCIVQLERGKAEPVSLVRTVEGGAFPIKRFRLDDSAFPQPCSSKTLDLNEYRCQNVCFACGTLMMVEDLSQCLNAHRCCSECLQKQAKTLLTRQTKVCDLASPICGSSAVECRTHNRDSPCSNPLCYRFKVWAFSFSP